MSTDRFELSPVPDGKRERELWLQHAAGFILWEDVRGYARERLPPSLDPSCRATAEKAIDDALYGLMMVIDGVTGALRSEGLTLSLRTSVRLADSDSGQVVDELDLSDQGDGFCMGYHGWREGDFGEHPPALRRATGP